MFEDLRVGPQWALSPDDIRVIAADYDLNVVTDSARRLGGAVNGVVRVASDRGPLVFRVHRPWTTSARLAGLHQLQDTLRAAGYPIPRLLRSRAGTTWTGLADRLVEVSAFVASDETADSWARSEAAFAMLGRLHTLLSGIAPDAVPAPAYSSYATPATALAMLAGTDARIESLAGQPGYAEVIDTREATRELLRTLAVERDRYEEALPRCLVHGDYGGDNVLLRDGRIAAVLDFDFLAYRERIFDLAYALYWALDRFCRPREDAAIPDHCLAHAAELARHYHAHVTPALMTAEVVALPFEMARVPLYQIAEAGYTASVEGTAGPIGQTLANSRHVPVARWLVANAPRVQVALTDALKESERDSSRGRRR